MGLYIRKSVSVGPFRFNLSKSGIGVSAGVKGFRVGSGPRGNYVHMGRYGLYYRASLPSSHPQTQTTRGEGATQEIESGSALQMTDSTSTALLEEINRKRTLVSMTPFAAIAVVFGLGWMLFSGTSIGPVVLVCVLGTMIIAGAVGRDISAKTTVLLYDLEAEQQETYQELQKSFEELASSAACWHLEAREETVDRKYHGGATSLFRRKRISLRLDAPSRVRTNIAVPMIPVGRQTLYFFPDRTLVFAPEGVGAVNYSDLCASCTSQRFVEEESLPSDATVVDHTWRYVNKQGGPDRRFSNNPSLSIAIYEQLSIRSDTGLNEFVQFSRVGPAQRFIGAIKAMAQNVPSSTEDIPKQPREISKMETTMATPNLPETIMAGNSQVRAFLAECEQNGCGDPAKNYLRDAKFVIASLCGFATASPLQLKRMTQFDLALVLEPNTRLWGRLWDDKFLDSFVESDLSFILNLDRGQMEKLMLPIFLREIDAKYSTAFSPAITQILVDYCEALLQEIKKPTDEKEIILTKVKSLLEGDSSEQDSDILASMMTKEDFIAQAKQMRATSKALFSSCQAKGIQDIGPQLRSDLLYIAFVCGYADGELMPEEMIPIRLTYMALHPEDAASVDGQSESDALELDSALLKGLKTVNVVEGKRLNSLKTIRFMDQKFGTMFFEPIAAALYRFAESICKADFNTTSGETQALEIVRKMIYDEPETNPAKETRIGFDP